ncbi:MAG: winged helix-turn-helix domain-containing protein [Candidatus Competibacteraceae bacterium]|nr:winged helix-turn-helix domain-containing protein [Candidatus Competibacteraceae bacterium]
MELIETLFGVAMPIRTVGEHLSRWGYSPQRPLKRALEQRPAEVQRWLDETYPSILARAKAEKAVIYWGDETAVVEDGHWCALCASGKNAGACHLQPPVWIGAGVGHQQTKASSGSALSSRP